VRSKLVVRLKGMLKAKGAAARGAASCVASRISCDVTDQAFNRIPARRRVVATASCAEAGMTRLANRSADGHCTRRKIVGLWA